MPARYDLDFTETDARFYAQTALFILALLLIGGIVLVLRALRGG